MGNDKMCDILETASDRAKRTKILDLRGKYLVYIEYFWLLSVQIHFGDIRTFPLFDNLTSQKKLAVERNGAKFGPHR